MSHTKTLLLINNEKSQILKFHILRKHSVGSDNNIHHAFFQIFDGFLLLFWAAETAKQIYSHREIFHPLGKGIIMLLRQDCGRY